MRPDVTITIFSAGVASVLAVSSAWKGDIPGVLVMCSLAVGLWVGAGWLHDHS